ncbi:MAG: response regulator [Bacillota bacterium]|nr:response regulator [Bacillota bacterium]
MKEKILVVDDDKNIRLLLTQCLEEAGYQVVPAVDGQHALKKAEEERFDLVMLDMKLPDLDGLQVLKRLRAANPGQLVIIITAHGTIETAVEAMKLGAVDYLQKPFTPEEIRSIVYHTLAKKAVPQAEGCAGFEECVEEARVQLKENQLEKALALLRRAVTLNPERPEPFNLLGAVDELRGNLDAARRMYRVALALDPTYKPAELNLDRVTRWKYELKKIYLGEAGEEEEAPAGEE